MVAGQILLKKLEEKGIKEGEKIALAVYEAIQETVTEAAIAPEATASEKTICAVMIPVLAGFAPTVKSLVDFNKDGVVG